MMRLNHRAAACFVAFAVLFCSAVLLAAEAGGAKVAKITVFKNDGKSVTGEFIESTPAGVKIKASPKAEPEMVAWPDIKRTSNGLTRLKVVDEWRSAKKELLCETCLGGGTTKCDVCHGTGVDPAQATPCDKCKGEGSLGKCPKCTYGKIACPNNCLKPAMFAGLTVNPDGKKHKTFHNKDGSTAWFSEGHIGALIVQENGSWVDKGKCPLCNGTSEVICPTCHGTAKRECPTCHGAGVTGPTCTTCKAGQVTCKTCSGTGLKTDKAADPAAPTNP